MTGESSIRSRCTERGISADVHSRGMDEKAIRRAALITVRRAICERFPPGRERQAWLRWLTTKTPPVGGRRNRLTLRSFSVPVRRPVSARLRPSVTLLRGGGHRQEVCKIEGGGS